MSNTTNDKRKIAFFRSLRGKLTIYFVLIALISLAVSSALNLSNSSNMLKKQIREELQISAEHQASAIGVWVDERKDDMVTLAKATEGISLDSQSVGAVIEQYHQQWDFYQNLIFITPDGERLYDTAGSTSNLIDRGYFIEAINGNVNASDTLVSRTSGKIIIVFAAPVYKGSEVIGVIAGPVQINYISGLLEKVMKGESGDAYLIDSHNMIMTNSRYSETLVEKGELENGTAHELALEQDVVDKLAGGEEFYENFQGTEMIGAAALIENQNWKIIIEQSTEEAFELTRKASNSALLVLGIVFAAVILIAFFISRSITKPISQIAESSNQIADGDLEVEIAVQTKDEIGQLADSLRAMTQQLKDKIHWYEALLDSIPLPISVTDMDMNWTFINKPVTDMLGIKRKDVLGHQCNEWGAGICNTENCGIKRLREGFSQTFFDQMGGDFQVDTSYVLSAKGEQIGHIEVVQDITKMTASNKYQEKEVEKLSTYLGNMAVGDLEFEIKDLEEGNENTREVEKLFGVMLESFRNAKEMLRETIAAVVESADQVSDASGKLTEVARQSGMATGQISTTIQQIAEGAQQQAQAVTQTSTTLNMVSETVNGVVQGTRKQAESVDKTTEITNQITRDGGISDTFGETTRKINELGKRSEEIGMIIETIEDIASQTNLLALNAAIEAARAGDHGKGFAVVADEVRKLAERSSTQTKEIGDLVKAIQTNVNEVVQMAASADENLNIVSHELEDTISVVAQVVDDNTGATEKLLSGTDQASFAMENIASVSEENSASVEEVGASAEEMTAQAEDVANSAEELSQMAVMLQELVARFKI